LSLHPLIPVQGLLLLVPLMPLPQLDQTYKPLLQLQLLLEMPMPVTSSLQALPPSLVFQWISIEMALLSMLFMKLVLLVLDGVLKALPL